jgi:hypothetical protein
MAVLTIPPLPLSIEQRAAWRAGLRPHLAQQTLGALAEQLSSRLSPSDLSEASPFDRDQLFDLLRRLRAGEERGIRFFLAEPRHRAALLDALDLSEEALSSLIASLPAARIDEARPARAEAPSAEAPSAPTPPPDAPPPHRLVGARSFIEHHTTQARALLAAEASLVPALLEISRAQAVELCLAGQPPDAFLASPTPLITARITQLHRSPADPARRRHLGVLLTRCQELQIKAGWHERTPDGVRFLSPILPQLLVGASLAADPGQAAALRERIGANRRWSEAAWAATAEGDPLTPWLGALLAENDPVCLQERIIALCAALGGLPESAADPAIAGQLTEAFPLCLAALAGFSPIEPDPLSRGAGDLSPWELPLPLWQRCILDLAQGASRFTAVLPAPLGLRGTHRDQGEDGDVGGGLRGRRLRLAGTAALSGRG